MNQHPKQKASLSGIFLVPFSFIFVIVFSLGFFNQTNTVSKGQTATSSAQIATSSAAVATVSAQLTATPSAKPTVLPTTTATPKPTATPTVAPTASPSATIVAAMTQETPQKLGVERGLPGGSIEGNLVENISDNFDQHNSASSFFLTTRNGKMYELENSANLSTIAPGSTLRFAQPSMIGGKVVSKNGEQPSFEVLSSGVAPRVTGAQKGIGILLRFAGTTTAAPTAQSFQNHLNGSLRSYLSEASYGKISFTADAKGWFNGTIQPNCDFYTIANEAVRQADPTTDFRTYTHLLVVHPEAGCGYAGRGSLGGVSAYNTNEGVVYLYTTLYLNTQFNSDLYALRVTSHELGHNFGAHHANGLDCGAAAIASTCTSQEYYDRFDSMGSNLGYHYNGFTKAAFSWMVPSNTLTVTANGTYTLSPIETATGTPQVIKIRRNATESYFIENRVATGFDAGIGASAVSGILVRTASWLGVQTNIIDATPNSAPGVSDFEDAGFAVGRSFIDPAVPLTVTVLSKDGNQARVNVAFSVAPPAAPTLTSPSNGATNVSSLRPTFDWNDVDGVTGYTIQASTVTTFASLLVNTSSPTSSYTHTKDLPKNAKIYWRVRSVRGTSVGAWSTAFSFTTPNPPSIPVAKTPANNTVATSLRPTFTWTASVPPGDQYKIEIKNGTRIVMTGTSSTTSFTAPSDLAAGTVYQWSVQALNSAGHMSAFSAPFTVKTPLAAPTLDSPANGSTAQTARPAFGWRDVDGAVSYYLQTSTDGVTFRNLAVVARSSLGLSPYYVPAADIVPKSAKIYWRVLAYNATFGYSVPSAVYSFTSANPPSIPVPKLPANNSISTTMTPTLTWTAATGVGAAAPTRYHVQVYTSTSQLVFENANVPLSTIPSWTTPTLSAGSTYLWRVRALNSAGQFSLWSTTFTLKTALSAPSVSSPANNSSANSSRPTFDWSDVNGAASYYLQTSTNGTTFANYAAGVVGSTFTPTKDIVPKGAKIYWRVLAYNATYGYSAPSQVFSFTSANPPAASALVSPIGNALLTNISPVFTWNAAAGTGTAVPTRYDLEISEVSSFSTVFHSKTGITATTPRVTYAPGKLPYGKTYYWRVRAYNSAGQVGVWSATGIFRTPVTTVKLGSRVIVPGTHAKSVVFTQPFAGVNKLMLVSVSYRQPKNTIGNINSVTFAGTRLTQVRREQAGEYVAELFYLPPTAAPLVTTGLVNVVFNGSTDSHQITGFTYTGVNQSQALRTTTGVGDAYDPFYYSGTGQGFLFMVRGNGGYPFAIHTTYAGLSNTVTSPATQTALRKSVFLNTISTVTTSTATTDSLTFEWNTRVNWPWAAVGVSLQSVE